MSLLTEARGWCNIGTGSEAVTERDIHTRLSWLTTLDF